MRGFVDFRSAREFSHLAARKRPVGGAPSRSGFLATPIDASPRQTFSTDSASREKRCRVAARSEFAKAMSHSEGLTLSRRFEKRTYERNPNRSDLGPASRTCDARARLVAKSSGRVKVRASRRLVAQASSCKEPEYPTDSKSQRELELSELGIHDSTRMASQWPDHPATS